MNIITWQLLLKWIISFGALYLFYIGFLTNMTFFRQRRWYILMGTLLAFVIPFITMNVSNNNDLTVVQYIQKIPAVPPTISTEPLTSQAHFTLNNILSPVFVLGVMIYSIRFILILFSLKKMTKNAIFLYELENSSIYCSGK